MFHLFLTSVWHGSALPWTSTMSWGNKRGFSQSTCAIRSLWRINGVTIETQWYSSVTHILSCSVIVIVTDNLSDSDSNDNDINSNINRVNVQIALDTCLVNDITRTHFQSHFLLFTTLLWVSFRTRGQPQVRRTGIAMEIESNWRGSELRKPPLAKWELWLVSTRKVSHVIYCMWNIHWHIVSPSLLN